MLSAKMQTRWLIGSLLGLLVIWLSLPLTAAAHPLGNFTINRYSRIELGAAGINLYYVLDVAEIPTFQEKDKIDLDRDGQISDSERLAYLSEKLKDLQSGLKLAIDGTPVDLKLVSQNLAFLPGQGGLQTMRLTANFKTPALTSSSTKLAYQDENYADRVGWREIVVRNATGIAIIKSSVSDRDQSDELRTYPQDMLSSPLAVTSAQVNFRLDSSVVVKDSSAATTSAGVINRGQDPFADLVNSGELTLPLVLFSLVASFVWGALHAFSPGHGKTVVAAYLVGTHGTARHALFLGLTVTVTHTLGVFALGLITLLASQFIVPDKLYPWLGLLSGLIVVVMGINMLRSRLSFAMAGASAKSHDHGHIHPDDTPAHQHDDLPEHSHQHEQSEQSPGYTHPEHTHAHEFDQPQDHSHHEHSQEHAHPHADEVEHVHSHNGQIHSHLPPGADGTEVTWKKLLSFGISAGLLPCPSALIVMLSTIALGRVAFGIVLIILFSLGLAATLSGMGLLFVYARRFMSRIKIKPSSQVLKILPVVSAFIITVLGLAISYEALIQTGVFK